MAWIYLNETIQIVLKKYKKMFISLFQTLTWIREAEGNILFKLPFAEFNLYHSLDKFSRWQMNDIILIFFLQKIGFDTSCKLSPKETICMKCQSLFSALGDSFHEVLKPIFWKI